MLTKVAVVGAGPVGLLGCLLLQTFGLDYLCFEKADRLRSHPSAHWLSARSKQILSQIVGLPERIDAAQEDFAHFRYYRYCERVGGFEFGRTDHFVPSIDERLAVSRGYFGQSPNHISQSKFLSIEYEQLKDKRAIRFDQQIKGITSNTGLYHLTNQRGELIARSKYVVLTNGYHSPLREKAGIRMEGGREFYRLVNIHFKSRKLAEAIQRRQCEAMLHFVYNGVVPCVLVNHSLEEGEFVLQVPNYEPFVDLLSVYSPEQLLQTALAPDFYSAVRQDLVIVHVGRWKLQAQLSDRMYSGNLFIAGDTAHTYTPAGGFGMNCGLQDINQLMHGLHTIERNSGVNATAVAETYNRDRLVTNGKYLEKSLNNYTLTEETANALGFPSGLTDYFFRVCRMMPMGNLPLGMNFAEKLRLVAMGQLYSRKTIEPKLELFFDQFDARVQPISTYFPHILESIRNKQIYDLWVDPSVSVSQLDSIYGPLDPSFICRTTLPQGESIVRRDGIILYPR